MGEGGLPGLGGSLVPGGIPACTEADTPPVDRHTLVKTLPWPNFAAAGNKSDWHLNKIDQFKLSVESFIEMNWPLEIDPTSSTNQARFEPLFCIFRTRVQL